MALYVVNADVFRVAGLPSDGSIISTADVDAFILEAIDYVERMLGTTFATSGEQVTEVYDGDGTDTLVLDHFPIISIDSLTINGTSVTTSLLYTWDAEGIIRLKSTAEVTKFSDSEPQLVSITYTYGETPDERITHYTAIIAAMMTLIAQIGGTFDDVTSFSVPEMEGSLGEPYTNIREALQRLIKQEEFFRPYVRIKPQFG